jgi:hypothetical protein
MKGRGRPRAEPAASGAERSWIKERSLAVSERSDTFSANKVKGEAGHAPSTLLQEQKEFTKGGLCGGVERSDKKK